jgi:glycosyltransferase involved in cell wall biosynthesis
MLLRAFAALRRTHEAAHLTIAGEGERLAALRALAAELRVTDRVSFLGAVRHDELTDLYRQADAFVLSSRFESQSMATLEAAACGRAIVGTAVGVLPDLGDAARTVPPGDAHALARVLASVLEDDAVRERMGQAALRVARERYSVESAVSRFRAVYDEVVKVSRAVQAAS